MPAATNKADLIAVTIKDFEKLDKLLSGLDAEKATWIYPEDGLSIRDVIAHRAHWIGLYLSWYEDGLAGLDVQTPAPGYKWNQLKAYNGRIYDIAKRYSWDEILTCFRTRHQSLLDHIEGLDDAALYTKHLHPWMNDWPLGRWAEASGASHYRSAAKYARKIIKAMG